MYYCVLNITPSQNHSVFYGTLHCWFIKNIYFYRCVSCILHFVLDCALNCVFGLTEMSRKSLHNVLAENDQYNFFLCFLFNFLFIFLQCSVVQFVNGLLL